MALLDAFLDAQWGMEPHKLGRAAELLLNHSEGARIAADEILAVTKAPFAAYPGDIVREPGYFTRGSVAVIPIGGVISKFSRGVTGVSTGPGTSVTTMRRTLRNAQDDEDIRSIMLLIDSPGGNVKGIDDVAQDIRALRDAGMPVVTYVEDMMASAALWIGAQADEVFANRGAEVGSIGVYTVLIDSSEKAKAEGVRVKVIAGRKDEMKAIGVPGAKVTDAQEAEVQSRVDSIMDMFVEAVATSPRRIDEEDILKIGGRMLSASDAAGAGLIDGISTAEEVLDRMNAQFGGRTRRSASTGATAMRVRDTKDGKDVSGGTGNDSGKATDDVDDPPAKTAAEDLRENGQIVCSRDEFQTLVREGVTEALSTEGKRLAERADEIKTLARGWGHIDGVNDLVQKALADTSIGIDAFRTQLIKVAEDGLKPVGVISVGESGDERRRTGIELALLGRAFPDLENRMLAADEPAKRLARQMKFEDPGSALKALDTAQGEHLHEMSLLELARSRVAGGGRNLSVEELIAISLTGHAGSLGFSAAGPHTTSDFPSILQNVLNKMMLTSFAEENTTWQRWCRVGSLKDFKPSSLITLSAAQDLLETPEGQEAKHSTFAERAEANLLRTFTRRFGMTRQMMINDDLGAFAQIPTLMGRAAARVPDILAYERINNAHTVTMSDGVAFFNTATRGNLIGTPAALSADSLQAAITVMMLQRDFGPDRAEIMPEPRFLLAPVELQFTARKLFVDTVKVGGTNAESNPVQGRAEPIVSSRLSRVSSNDWVLLAEPGAYPVVEVGFLNGRRVPLIVRVGDGSPLQVQWEVVFDCGAALVQPEGAVKTPGS